jgi:hypothetical protein
MYLFRYFYLIQYFFFSCIAYEILWRFLKQSISSLYRSWCFSCVQITKLKIESNPFAKGFRDSSSQDGEDPFPSFYSGSGLPGGMPGLDPFSHLRGSGPSGPPLPHPLDNNNILEAAEKARIMMLYRHQLVFPPSVSSSGGGLPPPPRPPPLPPLPADLLARYNSAVQATLGLYNPSLLAAALRNSAAIGGGGGGGGGGGPASQLLLPPPPHLLASAGPGPLPPPALKQSDGSRTSPTAGLKSPRFSPYVLPQPQLLPRKTDSPSHHSTASDDEGRSPASSPPATEPPPHPLSTASRPTFSLFRWFSPTIRENVGVARPLRYEKRHT